MTHQGTNHHRAERGYKDIVARDEINPSLARQLFNGISGTLVLLLTGIIILIMVLWKTR